MIAVENISHRSVYSSEIIYFTGGLTVFRLLNGEYALGPVRRSEKISFYQFNSVEHAAGAAALAGACQAGTNETIQMSSTKVSVWRPAQVSPKNGLNTAADIWSGISYSAHLKSDKNYQTVGRYISVSLQAAGIRLRDVALRHHEQLMMALEQPSSIGMGFSNIPMLDLYLAFHSLATELCSVRDHLAKLTAMHIQAKDSVDNMPRLEEWLKKPAHKDYIQDPLVQLMMTAWGSIESPGFLRILGDLRNKMVHRQPMSANPESAMLRTKQTETDFGPILTIRLAPMQSREPDDSTPDPFQTILGLSQKMEKLATQAAGVSKYEPQIMTLFGK